MRALLVGGVVVVASITPALAAGLAPKDIQSTFFNGQPFTSSTMSNVKFKMVFTPDGKMTREPVAKTGAKAEGTWKLSKEGFCTTWKGSHGQLLPHRDRGRQQMAGGQGNDRGRDLVEVISGGAQRDSTRHRAPASAVHRQIMDRRMLA